MSIEALMLDLNMNVDGPRYGMFTEAGDDAVAAIVRTARVLNLSWQQVNDELYSLAERFPNDFAEATDTEVRECVWVALGF
jgi:hypothetical protein